MTVYTILPQDDSNLDVTVTDPAITAELQDDSDLDVIIQEAENPVVLNITPAAVSITSAVTSVNGLFGDVTLTTSEITEGDNLYYTDARVDAYLQSGSVTEVDWDGYTLTKNTDEDTLDLALENGVVLQLGQEQLFYGKATEVINDGDVVQFAGAQGDHLLIARADMSSPGFQPEYVIGVATQNFAKNQFGYVTDFGKVRGLDTDTPGWPEGTILYLDPNTPGGYVTTEPSPPNHSIQIAAVTRRHQNQGTIFVRPTHHPDTDEVAEGIENLYYTDARVQAVIDTNSAGFATTAYVDTAEADAITTANAYTDTREIAITTAYEAYADQAETDAVSTANAYTDGRETAITTAYQTYADTAEADANTYTDTAIANLVDSAPETLDTLNELAAALGDDPNFATTITNSLSLKANTADLGATAFSNDYNDLDNLPTIPDLTGYATEAYVDQAETDAVATANAYTDANVFSGDYTDLTNKPTIPTNNNELTNGAGYITADSADTLTNKSGNISMFTNDAGYLTSETDSQTLSFTSPNLTISNGNSVDLSSLEVDETDGGTY